MQKRLGISLRLLLGEEGANQNRNPSNKDASNFDHHKKIVDFRRQFI